MLRTSIVRASALAPSALARRTIPAVHARNNASYAVSNVELVDIEKRWELLPPAEQAELWMSLRDRMKGPWGELTMQEKKACAFTFYKPPL